MRTTVRLGPEDRGRYVRVPFRVERGDGPVRIRLDYDRGLGTIDLGLWDPDGWRGYSGGARSEVVLADGAATPGYAAGALQAGDWAVELGVHRVRAGGLDVVVDVDTRATGVVPEAQVAAAGEVPAVVEPRGSERGLPAEPGLTWFAGDFHTHSVHSDGTLTLDELAQAGASAGLDFVAITDHNTVSHHRYLADVGRRQGITLIPGQELTTDRGHANVFGDVGWIDFHRPPIEWIAEAERRGGLVSINHPLAGSAAWQWEIPAGRLPQALEFWHVTWFGTAAEREAVVARGAGGAGDAGSGDASDAGAVAARSGAGDPGPSDVVWPGLTDTAMFALWARWGQGVALIGGSDFHADGRGLGVGMPTTWVAARDSSVGALLDGVRAGRTAISRGTTRLLGQDPAREPVLLPLGRELAAVDGEGLALVSPSGGRVMVGRGDGAGAAGVRGGVARAAGAGGRSDGRSRVAEIGSIAAGGSSVVRFPVDEAGVWRLEEPMGAVVSVARVDLGE